MILILSASAFAEHSTRELLEMTDKSLNADWENNIAFVRGVSLLKTSNPQGIFLARRGALTDARRGLLILRHRLLKSKSQEKISNIEISGNVPPLKMLSEGISNDVYFVEVQVLLTELLGQNAFKSLSKINNLPIENLAENLVENLED